MSTYLLGIESSCDDTAAAVLRDDIILSNITAGQEVHRLFGGVVPELASRAHQQNIVPVIDAAIRKANITKKQLSAVAFTQGPGLLGSLLVGVSFAKSFALALGIPLVEVDHLKAHILAHFIKDESNKKPVPRFPFLCLTVSGGHTQLVRVDDYDRMNILGQTIDDAAGETFDKAAKIMGLPYPGGPVIDNHAKSGDPFRFSFSKPVVAGLNFSFSGLKTSILYFLRDELRKQPGFIEQNMNDLCASIQNAILEMLMEKLVRASEQTGITEIGIAGGVSANTELRRRLHETGTAKGWNIFIPKFEYTTDNAAMIAIAGYYKFLRGEFGTQTSAPYARSRF